MRFQKAARLAVAVLAFGLVVGADADASPTTAKSGRATDAAASDPDRVVATVNGRPIRLAQLDAAVEADRKRRYLGIDLSDAEWRSLKIRALERLIGRELLFQAAQRKQMKVSLRVLDKELAAARPAMISEEVYQKHLEKAGLDKEKLIRQMRIRLLSDAYAKVITDGVVVGDDAVREAYEEDRERFVDEDEVRCAHIVILVPEDASAEVRESARARIEEVRRRAVAGEDFAELARAYSDSPFADRGGDLGFLYRGRMRPEFDAVVFETPVGEITPVFETAYGFNLVKIIDRRDATLPSYEEVRASLRMHLARERNREVLHGHIRELWEEADVVIMDPELEAAH